ISLSAGSTIARASSGSRSSISSVEPLMSANSAVTVLRSPSAVSPVIAAFNGTDALLGRGGADGADSANGAPHSPQNLSPVSFEAPQREQRAASGAPHSAQNLRLCRLSPPHFEQRISHTDCPQAFSAVAQALACDALNKQPLVAAFNEIPLPLRCSLVSGRTQAKACARTFYIRVAAAVRANGAKHISPGQRPGKRCRISIRPVRAELNRSLP